jgi:hypothetical protein
MSFITEKMSFITEKIISSAEKTENAFYTERSLNPYF